MAGQPMHVLMDLEGGEGDGPAITCASNIPPDFVPGHGHDSPPGHDRGGTYMAGNVVELDRTLTRGLVFGVWW